MLPVGGPPGAGSLTAWQLASPLLGWQGLKARRGSRGQGRRDDHEDDTCKQRSGIFEERINQRRPN